MKTELLIKPRWLITVDAQDRVLTEHAIAIDQGKIIAILPQAQAEQQYQATQTLDMPHHALLPGFINAHTHAAMALLKGLADDLPLMEWLQKHIWPAEAQLVNEAFVYDGTRLAIAEMLRSGTTCFNDMYFFAPAALKAVKETGIRAALGMIMIDFPSAYAQNADEYLEKAQQLQKLSANESRITTLFAPHAPYTVSDKVLQQVLLQSQQLNTPIHMHVHETAFEVEDALRQFAERPLIRLARLGLLDQHFLAVHMTQLQDEEIALLAEKAVHVVHCPESNLKLASGFCPVAKLLKAGVNVALGTDGNASNNDLDMLSEMRSAALLAKAVAQDASAVTAQQALRMATINGAKVLGIDQLTGSLEVGKAADMIAINMHNIESYPLYETVSHIVYCATRSQVTDSWVAGQALLKQGKLTTLNETELMTNAQAWQTKIGEFAL